MLCYKWKQNSIWNQILITKHIYPYSYIYTNHRVLHYTSRHSWQYNGNTKVSSCIKQPLALPNSGRTYRGLSGKLQYHQCISTGYNCSLPLSHHYARLNFFYQTVTSVIKEIAIIEFSVNKMTASIRKCHLDSSDYKATNLEILWFGITHLGCYVFKLSG